MCQQLYTTAMAMVVNIGHKGCKGPREHAMGCCFIWLTAGCSKMASLQAKWKRGCDASISKTNIGDGKQPWQEGINSF